MEECDGRTMENAEMRHDGKSRVGGMQRRGKDEGIQMEGCRDGGMQRRRNAEAENAETEECRGGGMQRRRNAGTEERIDGGMQREERRDGGMQRRERRGGRMQRRMVNRMAHCPA